MSMGRGVTQTFRCRAETVPRVRAMVGGELQRHGIDDDLVDRIVLASAEACNNAILHSQSPSYVISVEVADDACAVTVRDAGVGFAVPDVMEMPEPNAVSRRGLALMCVLVEQVDVKSNGAGGTTVVLRQPLNGALPDPVALTCF
jgi:anti-sigma regulatory factor (Ser/Thr protein kinase)